MIYLLLLNGEYVPTINRRRAGHVIFVSNVQCKWLKSDYHHKVKPARWTTISKLNRFQRKNQIRSESRWFNVKLDLTVGPVDTVCIRYNSTNFMVSSWFTRPNMERNNHWIASTKWRYIVPSSDLKSAAVVVYYCVLEVLALYLSSPVGARWQGHKSLFFCSFTTEINANTWYIPSGKSFRLIMFSTNVYSMCEKNNNNRNNSNNSYIR